MKRTKSKIQQLTQDIYNASLSCDELEELQLVIAGLIDSLRDREKVPEEEDNPPTRSNWQQYRGKRGGKGYLEIKNIRSGKSTHPYLYLRYWQGKKLKSIYLGRTQGQESARVPSVSGWANHGIDDKR